MGREPRTPRERAVAFLAAYERPGAGPYERHVVSIARRWLRIMASRRATQGAVNHLLAEFDEPRPVGYGCAWEDLQKHIVRWATDEGWLEPEG